MSGGADISEYDELDVLVNRLLYIGEIPVPTVGLTAEMVEFYKTPVRVVLELAERVNWGPEDVFFDLGSGLGQLVMLVNILTGVVAKGVEIEPAYCEYARACAAAHRLSDVEFIAGDARVADLSAGTVFFLFTPFKGEVFCQVMERVRVLALTREIRVIGYGPCSAEIARLGWLKRDEGGMIGEYSLQIFTSH
jgi:SAM-dependent methyltransferase